MMSSNTIKLFLLTIATVALSMPFHQARQQSYPVGGFTPTVEGAEECIERGFQLGVVGLVTKTSIFIKACFLWMGRSILPPFNSNRDLKGKLEEYFFITGAILASVVSLGSGIAFATEETCEDNLLLVMRGLNLYFNYAVDLSSIVFAIRRWIRVRNEEEIAQKNSKLTLIANVWLGINGWLHWAAIGRMAYWGTPLPLSPAVPGAYWAVVLVLVMLVIFTGLMGKITGYENKIVNTILAFVFWGGFASAFFAELVGGLVYDTIDKVPGDEVATSILGWVFPISTVIGQFATGS